MPVPSSRLQSGDVGDAGTLDDLRLSGEGVHPLGHVLRLEGGLDGVHPGGVVPAHEIHDVPALGGAALILYKAGVAALTGGIQGPVQEILVPGIGAGDAGVQAAGGLGSSTFAVRKIMGQVTLPRIRLHTSNPSILGILMSSKIISGFLWIFSKASVPSSAIITSYRLISK